KRNIQINNEEFRNRIDLLTNINIEKDENGNNDSMTTSSTITNDNTYHRFSGQNVMVAIMAFGNNQEDSVIFNARSIDNGLFSNIKYRYQYVSYNIKEEMLSNINENYENGLPKPNTPIAQDSSCSNEIIFKKYNLVK
ncbi:hypothetical protein BCR36DRAFT_247267, partial [Piromyces finnis]